MRHFADTVPVKPCLFRASFLILTVFGVWIVPRTPFLKKGRPKRFSLCSGGFKCPASRLGQIPSIHRQKVHLAISHQSQFTLQSSSFGLAFLNRQCY